MAVSSFFRDEGILCSIYIDDRLTGALMRSSEPWSVPAEKHTQGFSQNTAEVAILLVFFYADWPWLRARFVQVRTNPSHFP